MTIQSMIDKIEELRIRARQYPYYRVIERMVRVGVAAALVAGMNAIVAGWTGVGIDSSLTVNAIWLAGIYGGLDKLKNEWSLIKREYNMTSIQGFFSLFMRD